MAIKFKVVERKNPLDRSLDAKHYAYAVRKDIIDLDRLAALMGDGGTVRKLDVYAVLVGAVDTISEELRRGNQVNLGQLGNFYISLNAEGQANADQVTAATIKKVNLRYRPAKEMRKLLSVLDFEKDSPPEASASSSATA